MAIEPVARLSVVSVVVTSRAVLEYFALHTPRYNCNQSRTILVLTMELIRLRVNFFARPAPEIRFFE